MQFNRIVLLVLVSVVIVFYVISTKVMPTGIIQSSLQENAVRVKTLSQKIMTNLTGKVELTLRMPASENKIKYFVCDFLRSATLYWRPSYGDIHIILDDGDNNNMAFVDMLRSISLPFTFRFYYEKETKRIAVLEDISMIINRPLGYVTQLYSSFFMDLYTNASVLAWTDTDSVFTIPVFEDDIMRNGKLVVKGMNTFNNEFPWTSLWDKTNIDALRLSMVSDFMTYFPVYIHPSTIKNCREFIMNLYGTESFIEAMHLFVKTIISPVNIIMSYAYYYERHRYEWHLDVGASSLENYNEARLPRHPLESIDTQPELHSTLHIGHYTYEQHPLEISMCYLLRNLGAKIHRRCYKCCANSTSLNYQLFEFSNNPRQNHFETWCKNGEKRQTCDSMIKNIYLKIKERCKRKEMNFNLSLIQNIDRMAEQKGINCSRIQYSRFDNT